MAVEKGKPVATCGSGRHVRHESIVCGRLGGRCSMTRTCVHSPMGPSDPAELSIGTISDLPSLAWVTGLSIGYRNASALGTQG
jgi:hypothetical protein